MTDSTAAMMARYQAAQGWTDTTMLNLLTDYIDEQGQREAFADYLSTRIYTPDEDDLDRCANGCVCTEQEKAQQGVIPEYLVTWQIDVEADTPDDPLSWGASNPTEAAMRAGITLMGAERLAERMAEPDSAVVFDVLDKRTGKTTRVDLNNEQGE